MALDKFDANNNGSFDTGDITTKAGEILTNKFDLDNDGVIEAKEVAQEFLITTGIGQTAKVAGEFVAENFNVTAGDVVSGLIKFLGRFWP